MSKHYDIGANLGCTLSFVAFCLMIAICNYGACAGPHQANNTQQQDVRGNAKSGGEK